MKRCLMAFILVGLVVPAVAYAATIVCDGGECTGTNHSDVITGSEKHDVIYAKAGDDEIDASTPNSFVDYDKIHAGKGDDTIDVYDDQSDDMKQRFYDVVYCGDGKDTVVADKRDQLSGCEDVTRK